MQEYFELLSKLKEISKQGYVRTHRAGDTGIGKTLEDLLGITENNIPGPNGSMIELKSARKKSKSMLTLFTKAPSPHSANSTLLSKLGYPSHRNNSEKELHTTVNAKAYNTLRGRTGMRVEMSPDRLELVTPRSRSPSLLDYSGNEATKPEEKEVLGYWTRETLRQSFERKLPRLLYVKADSKGKGTGEEFWYNEAWLLRGFGFENFVKLLQEGAILVDVRIGQKPDGSPHDHGTGFRTKLNKLDLCFSNRDRVV